MRAITESPIRHMSRVMSSIVYIPLRTAEIATEQSQGDLDVNFLAISTRSPVHCVGPQQFTAADVACFCFGANRPSRVCSRDSASPRFATSLRSLRTALATYYAFKRGTQQQRTCIIAVKALLFSNVAVKMPTHTPSPHRFLAPNPHSAQKSTRPHSSLRNVAAIPSSASAKTPTPAGSTELPFKRLTPAKRFVVAPLQKNPVAETAKVSEADANPDDGAQLQHTPLPRPRRKLERVESIEEPSQSSQQDAKEHVYASGVISSHQDQDMLSDQLKQYEQNEEDDEMLFEPATRTKRRRRSSPTSPSLQPLEPSTTHRFKVAPPRTPAPFPSIASVVAKPPAPSSRPHFILPESPTSPPKTSRPPPEIFSPSRKHAKYVPDGLASTVSVWVIEAANTGFAAQERSSGSWGRDKDDGIKVRVKISCLSRGGASEYETQELECHAGGVVFARGQTEPGIYNSSAASGLPSQNSSTNILLAGQGSVRGSGGVKINTGSMIGVRAPTWEIDVGQEKWLVAVDWVVLLNLLSNELSELIIIYLACFRSLSECPGGILYLPAPLYPKGPTVVHTSLDRPLTLYNHGITASSLSNRSTSTDLATVTHLWEFIYIILNTPNSEKNLRPLQTDHSELSSIPSTLPRPQILKFDSDLWICNISN
ncbi:hypothetical protein PSV08DRAFT_368464 [Bipolaris maydis]|uniref:uncharacterized protein n=1 Tax=Cochliobolus heterostrophus TaxID=5016 RepID=UPI0024D9650F|nr:hypothetical protein J3E73DRAFT_429116 [Bipolaris maydis]KAJ6275055.1 hypothetical protein PSV08DRAFT_368464 [Bipolaris maydis]KAJ6285659.1 hypothetical protein J3E71DRAFT_358610 [Bipolaris maydis]